MVKITLCFAKSHIKIAMLMLVNWCVRGELPGHSCKGRPQFTSTLHHLLPITVSSDHGYLAKLSSGRKDACLVVNISEYPSHPFFSPPSARPPWHLWVHKNLSKKWQFPNLIFFSKFNSRYPRFLTNSLYFKVPQFFYPSRNNCLSVREYNNYLMKEAFHVGDGTLQ